MIYESQKTPMGNIGVSTASQKEADAQAKAMDNSGCIDCSGCINCRSCRGCSDCSDCRGCSDCSGCIDCIDCSGCRGCINCIDCSGCRGCSDCSGCSGCRGCSDCSDCRGCRGVLQWSGPEVSNLLALNGLFWPVAISKDRMQIGCQNHAHEEWTAFNDREIWDMASGAPEFWSKHKEMLLGLCVAKAKMSAEGEQA